MQIRGLLLFTQPQKLRSAGGEAAVIRRSTEYLQRVSVEPLLERHEERLDLAARWAEQKWGYIAAVGRNRELSVDECIAARKDLIRELMQEPHGFYMVMMEVLGEKQPVGMFSLRAWLNKPKQGFDGLSEPLHVSPVLEELVNVDKSKESTVASHDVVQQAARLQVHLRSVMELDYVYLDENKRDLGLGGVIVRHAKEIAKSRGCNTLVLDTLNPLLNRFYKSQGAHELLESSYNTIPTEKLSINLDQDCVIPSRFRG